MQKLAERKLVDMWRLVRAAARDNKRLSTGDIAVLMALCDRYGSKYNPDLPPIAGQSLLGAMAGLSKRAAFDSTHRLMDAGYIEVIEPGSGTRGTKWRLNFSRGEAEFTAKSDSVSGEACFTASVNSASPLEAASDEAEFIESLPTVSGLQAGILEGSEPAPAVPPAVVADATSAAAVRDRFDEFWNPYPRKYQRAKAKAAWAKLDAADHDAAIEGARAYAEHCREAGREARYVKQAANWLAEECWLEDPAAGFTEKPARAERQPKAAKPAANDTRPANIKGGVTSMPKGEHLVEVTGYTDGDPWAAQAAVKLSLRPEGAATPFVHETYFAHPDDDEEDAGRRSLRTLVSATGGSSDNDNNPDPVGCWVWAVVNDTVAYRAALAPTSAQRAAMENGATQ